MKKQITVALLLLGMYSQAQIGIGTTTPNSTLDVRGSFSVPITTFSANTNAGASDNMLVFTGSSAATLTLPTAVSIAGREYWVKNASSNSSTLTIATTSSQTIDGLSSWPLTQTNRAIRLISNGANWYATAESLPGSSSWIYGGNDVTSLQKIGTTSNYDLPVITNNTEAMRIFSNSTGSVSIGSDTLDPFSAEQFRVDGGTTDNYNLIGAYGNRDGYLQFNIQNKNGGAFASTDIVATADNGTETSNYVNLGINSGTYNNASTSLMNGANNAYLFSKGQNFIIGNTTASKNIIFFTNSSGTETEQLRLTSNGISVAGSITVKHNSQNTTYTLTASDYVVINTSNPARTWTLPAANTCAGKVYKLVNHGGASITLSLSVYTAQSTTTTTLSNAAGSNTMEIMSDGSNWRMIK